MVTQSMMYLSSSSSIRLRASNLEKSWREDEWEVGGGEEEEEEEEGGGKRGEEMGGVAPMLEGKGWGKDSERTVWRGRPLSIDQSRGQWGRSSRRGEEIQENNSNNNSYDGDSPNIREAEERFLDLLAGCATPSVNRKSTKIKTLYNEIPFVVSINEEEEEEEEGEGDLFGEGGEGGKMVGMEKKVGMNSPLLLPFTPGLSQQRRGVVKKKKLHFSPLTRKEEGKGEALGMVEGRVSGEKEWKEGGEGGERGEDLGGKGGEVVVEKGEEGKEGEKRGEGMGGEQEIEEEVEEEGEKKDDTPEYMKLAKEQELILSVLKYEGFSFSFLFFFFLSSLLPPPFFFFLLPLLPPPLSPQMEISMLDKLKMMNHTDGEHNLGKKMVLLFEESGKRGNYKGWERGNGEIKAII